MPVSRVCHGMSESLLPISDQRSAGTPDRSQLHRGQGEHGHRQAHDEQADAVEGVGNGDRTQSAECGIQQSAERECAGDDDDRRVEREHRLHEHRAGVEHDRQQDEHVADQKQHRNEPAQARIAEAPFEQLGRRRALVLVVHRHEHVGEHEQTGRGAELPPGDEQHLRPVHADDLLGTDVGQQQRAGDERPGSGRRRPGNSPSIRRCCAASARRPTRSAARPARSGRRTPKPGSDSRSTITPVEPWR